MGDEVPELRRDVGLSPIKGCSFLQPRILDQLKAVASARTHDPLLDVLISRCVARGLITNSVARPQCYDLAQGVDEILDLVLAHSRESSLESDIEKLSQLEKSNRLLLEGNFEFIDLIREQVPDKDAPQRHFPS